MLIAPAGYGKTTLAEQWVARDGRVGIWYTSRSASTDVAALALGIARASTALIDDCDHRLREHLRALPAPAENIQTLAEILSEDLADWPANAWLVLDDYHEITPEPRAEDFIQALVALSPVQVLIASRVRPRWIATKEILYGDALELTQAALAMNASEATDVLSERPVSTGAGLVSLANGWPAVIGLASASSAEIGPEVEQLPESLYRFFADEVFGALSPEVQRGLATIAVAPRLDREVVVALLDQDGAERVCAAALDVGLVVERGSGLEFHPLARAFLDEQANQSGLVPSKDADAVCFSVYRERGDWDAAFDVVTRMGAAGDLAGLIGSALDDLLTTARLSTLERWCDYAALSNIGQPIVSLARAELMLRRGRHLEAASHARSASSDADIAFRALSMAGRAAHLASHEEAALELFRAAESAARNDAERRDARWGQLTCLIDLERPDAMAALSQLSADVKFGDARELVRMATNEVYIGLRSGVLRLDQADSAHQVIDLVGDPMVETSFLSGYSIALALAARYVEAEQAAIQLHARADCYRLDFALPYSRCALAMALAGQRQWSRALEAADEALTLASAHSDVHAGFLGRSVLLRLYAQSGQLPSALAVSMPSHSGAPSASVAELACSRAIALACAGRFDDALDLVEEVRGTTGAIEPAVLIPAVQSICAVRGNGREAIGQVLALGALAFETGALDLLVTTYRACPELLLVLLRAENSREFRELVERVGDSDLATAAGQPLATNDDRRLLLSPREREVFELLRSGFSNREIARLLYIEQSTVKAHAHHIYDKLGVRSRSALTVQAALERSAQATSAIEPTDVAGSS
jgi:LuxR family transcriptional regulator, maltose regulon positive regulatory protein